MHLLMNKHRPILEVEEDGGKIISMGAVLDQDFLPIQLQQNMTVQSLNEWFVKRQLPEKREGLAAARMAFRGFERDPHYFSLSDQYWVKRTQKDSWEKFNFFTNRYNKEVGKIFFEPWNVNRELLAQSSPDRTTTGVLIKRWVQDEDGTSYLIKAGSAVYHQEPLSEVLASIMLGKMKLIEYVPYELVIDGMRFCSRCKNFVDADSEFVPAAAIFTAKQRRQDETVYAHLLKMCEEFKIKDAKSFIDRMIIADHILCNSDRHLNNFGFLRSATTGKIKGFAPLFDCGSSYWGTQTEIKHKSSDLFPEEEKKLMEQAGKRGLFATLRSTQSMRRLIKGYPDINEKKKEDLFAELKEMDLELEQLSGAVIDEVEREDPNKKRHSRFSDTDFTR